MKVVKIDKYDRDMVSDIVFIHMKTFKGFFLTFMGKGFLNQLYKSYCEHRDSGILVAFDEKKEVLGFLAYSCNLSELYKFMIKKNLFLFLWYSLGAFLRKPKIFIKLLRAFLKPSESIRKEKYVELASIGVSPSRKSRGIGTILINELKNIIDFNKYSYITLETDAIENKIANNFYKKNEFILERKYTTNEGRKMNEYRFKFNEEE